MFFLELTCFFNDPANVGNLISGSSAFSKTSLNNWKFTVHVLLKSEFQKDRNNVVKKIIADMFQFAKTQTYVFKPSSEPPNRTNSEKAMLTHIRIKLLKSKHKNNFEITVRTFQSLFVPLCVSLCKMSSQFSSENIKLDNKTASGSRVRRTGVHQSPTSSENIYQ